MSTVADFIGMLKQHGSAATYHRDDSMIPCPCRTKQGYRDPIWHATDQPGLPGVSIEPGLISGYYEWAVRFQYPSGEKWNDTSMKIQLLDQQLHLFWQAAAENPVAGESATGVRVMRRRIDPVTDLPLDEYRQVVVATPNLTEWIDNEPNHDGLLLVGGIPSICNDAGMIPMPNATTEISTKAFVQPVQAGAVRRLTSEQLLTMFGEIQADDHIGFFPVEWQGKILNFYDWGLATEDWIIYNGRKFQVVSANLIPDPSDGNPWHHWEIGMRLISG